MYTQEIDNILQQSSVVVAPLLLGWEVSVKTSSGEILRGRIVETEAYHQADPASHSFKGVTPRTAPMFERAGTIYVYFTYGMHYCMNIVCGPKGRGEAVLLRALEPLDGFETMRVNRGLAPFVSETPTTAELKLLTSGPARLAQALGITTQQTGLHLEQSTLSLKPVKSRPKTIQTTRIGIQHAKEAPWRFFIADNPFVSKPASPLA